MKFRFRYQQILQYRKSLEDIASADYAEATRRTFEAEAELQRLYESISAAHDQAMQIRSQGGLASHQLTAIDQFIGGQDIRIDEQKKIIRDLKVIEEELQDVLRKRAIERKSLETLKEKQMVLWKKEIRHREDRQIDEIVTSNFPRRQLP